MPAIDFRILTLHRNYSHDSQISIYTILTSANIDDFSTPYQFYTTNFFSFLTEYDCLAGWFLIDSNMILRNTDDRDITFLFSS